MEQIIAIANRVLPVFCNLCLALLLAAGVFRLVELIRSSAKIRKHVSSLRAVDYRRFQDSEHMMPVSLILPATLETGDLKAAVDNLLSLEFKQYELIVVADSRNSASWESLQQGYHLLPFRQPYKKTLQTGEITGVYRSAQDVRLVVLDQRGTSNADALNAGVNVSSYPIIGVVYPDLRLTKDALLKAIYAFVSDPNCVFIGTFPRVGEGESRTAFAELQRIERLRTLFTHQTGYENLGVYLPLQHTFGAFLKSTVQESSGFSNATTGELGDLLLRMHARLQKEKRDYCARLLPEAICHQLPQAGMHAVCEQAGRMERARRAVCARNKAQAKALQQVFYTRVVETGWPGLELIGILIVAVSALTGAVSPVFLVSYLALSILLGSVQSVASVLLEESAFQLATDTGLLIRRYWLSILENCYYRLCVTLAKIFPGKN